jgi:ribosome-binding factor A
MSEEFPRARRVGQLLRREVACLIQEELKDPRIGWVTVSHVDVSPDLKHARVYVTILAEGKDVEEQLKALNNAAGFLQQGLGRRVKLRAIPRLQFIYDYSIERGRRLSALIDEAVRKDGKGKEPENSTK